MSIDSEPAPSPAGLTDVNNNKSTKASTHSGNHLSPTYPRPRNAVFGGLAGVVGDSDASSSIDTVESISLPPGTGSSSPQLSASDGGSLPVITQEVLQEHNHPDSLWVVHNGLVYDVTDFAKDHPGGFDLIYKYAGQNVSEIMQDDAEHHHSDSAYEILHDSLIGILDTHTSAVLPAAIAQSKMDKDFLKFNEPTVWQLLTSNYSKDYYLEQVHIPRHLTYDLRFFKYDFMELLTLTPWYIVPLVWGPVVSWSIYNGFAAGLRWETFLWVYPLGLLTWTLLEYVFHRYLFHMEELLPDNPVAITLHYLVHGVHHLIPMDRYRLAMPPVLFFLLQYLPRLLALTIFPTSFAHILYAGAVTGYIMYDLTHYFCHHASPGDGYLKRVKTYHMAHHYKDANLGFGVSSKLWDLVFKTTLRLR